MKRFGLCLVIVLLSQFLIAADWEGTAALSSSGLLPDEGYYIASNAFPRNTIVDLTNMETRQTIRVIVASGLDSPGMLAMVSRDAANMIGLNGTAIGRIRISLPNDLGLTSAIRNDSAARSGDPDHDTLAAVRSTNRSVEEYLEDKPPFVYPTEIDTNPANSAPANEVVNAPPPETFTPRAVTSRDDSVSAEMPPQPAWVYPLEVDETLANSEDAPPEEEDLSSDTFEMLPGKDDEPLLAEVSPEPVVEPEPETALAAAEPLNTEEDIPETHEPPLLLGEENPTAALVPTELKSSSSAAPIVSPEEIYETPASNIIVMEPGIVQDEDFPETTNPPVLTGDENPAITVVPSDLPLSGMESAMISSEENTDDEEIYETPESSIAMMEPELVESESDIPETTNPPVLTGDDNPAVAVIPSDLPPSDLPSETENKGDTPKNEASAFTAPAVIDPPADPVNTEPKTETELAFVPSNSRPPESGDYILPRNSEIVPLPESSPAVNTVPSAANPVPSGSRRFSVESISTLQPGAYYVQLGAFSESDSVEQVIEDVGSAYPLKVQSMGSSSRPLYKVLLGPVNIGEGSALLRRFKTRGYTDSFIVPGTGY